MRNQLSKLTYLPQACEAHGKGWGVIQKVPNSANLLWDWFFSERLDFFFVLTLIDGCECDVCVWWTVRLCACCQGLEPQFAASRAHAYLPPFSPTPAGPLLHTAMQTKGREGGGGATKKQKWPARVLMREGQESGIHLKPFLPPLLLSLEGFKSAAR